MMLTDNHTSYLPFPKAMKRKTSLLVPDRHSAFTPCKPKRRKLDNNSSSSDEALSKFSWLKELLKLASRTIHKCKVEVSKVCPWPLRFPMQCTALLQKTDSTSGTFGLLFLCQRTPSIRDTSEDYETLGCSVKPKWVKTGKKCLFPFLETAGKIN